MIFRFLRKIYVNIMRFLIAFWWEESLAGIIIFWVKAHEGATEDNIIEGFMDSLDHLTVGDYSRDLIEKHFEYLTSSHIEKRGSALYVTDLGEDYINSFLDTIDNMFVHAIDEDGKEYIVDYYYAYSFDLDVYYDFNDDYNNYENFMEITSSTSDII